MPRISRQALLLFCLSAVFCSKLGIANEKQLTIFALGDSTTAGTPEFRSPIEAPPMGKGNEQSQYAYWMMKAHPEWKVLNRGVNGERTDQILKRFREYTKTERPQIVIVLAGVNDLYQGYSEENVEVNLEKIYAIAVQKKIRIVTCSILPYNRMESSVIVKMVRVNKWIQEFSKTHQFIFCDTFKVVSDPNQFGKLAGSPDGLHPDVENYKKMGEAIAQTIRLGW